MTAYRKPIQNYRIINEVNIDIRYHKVHPGVVAEYEVLEASKFGNYTWEAFQALDVESKARCIAHNRLHNRIDNVIQQEISAYVKRRT